MSSDLGARLASVKNRGTLLITTRGRKSGKPHAVPIWFLVEDTTVFLATLNADRDWVRNAARTPDVELDLDTLRLRGRVSTVTDPGLAAHIRDLLARKYWMAWIGSWFGMGPARTFRVDSIATA